MMPQSPSFSPQRLRRRSADVGGLHLAVENGEQGQGWVGVYGELETRYAELLSEMYTQTLHAVNEHGSDFVPADLPPGTRCKLIPSLERWHFEPHKLPEEEVLSCTLILFEALFRIEGMEEQTGLSLKQISPFIHHLRRIYRLENSYHNFEHAVDVLQASHMYLRAARMVPPLSILLEPGCKWKRENETNDSSLITSLDLLDLFVIYIVAIGHDVGHPGFTNLFMKNAETPLSMVFDGKSALEQMHYQLLLRVMRCHGMSTLLDDPTRGPRVRKALLDTVLATDMSVHDQFMNKLQSIVNGENVSTCRRQITLCQAIVKCADISNPSRPYLVAKHWASALMEEWSSQAHFERHLHLPTTVQSSDSPLHQAKSQVFFITKFVKPLLDLTVQAVPEMKRFADACTLNLRKWTKRLKELEAKQDEILTFCPPSPRSPDNFRTAFPLTLPPSHRATSYSEEAGLVWSLASYPQSESSSGSSDSHPCSPSTSVSSFVLSPSCDSSTFRPPSSSGSVSSSTTHHPYTNPVNDSHAAIRAAGKLGMRRQKSMNRNSWSPSVFSTPAAPPKPAATFLESTDATPETPSVLMPSEKTATIVINPIKSERNKDKLLGR